MRIGAMLIVGTGEGERFLKEVLDMLDNLVDVIFVWGDAPDELTENIILSYKKVKYYKTETPLWGKLQWQIKETLINKYIIPTDIEWLVAVDADEVFDYRVNRAVLEELTTRGEIAFYFNFVTLWNDREHIRCDGTWGAFENIRFFKLLKDLKQTYRATPLHCGLAPIYSYNWGANCEYVVKHYGYMKEEDRLKKIERYKKYDPNQIYQTPNWYNSINSKAVVKPFNEKEFVKRFKYIPKHPKIEMIMQQKIEKVIFVKNAFGKINAVPESLLHETLQIPGMEVIEPPKKESLKEIEVKTPIVKTKPPTEEIKPEKKIKNSKVKTNADEKVVESK